mmetsp:Transcript_9052/g.24247  ORF Transcript_9052/g.24247 Transcript_9052/m.24247 type:complete len:234 (+) Transcript_9052:1959-2660(+)
MGIACSARRSTASPDPTPRSRSIGPALASCASVRFVASPSGASVGRATVSSVVPVIQSATVFRHSGWSSARRPSDTQNDVFAMSSKAAMVFLGCRSYIWPTTSLPMLCEVTWPGLSSCTQSCARTSAVNSSGRLRFPRRSAIQRTLVMFLAQTSAAYWTTAAATSSRCLAAATLPPTSASLLAYVRSTIGIAFGIRGSFMKARISSRSSCRSPLVSYFSTSSLDRLPAKAVIE